MTVARTRSACRKPTVSKEYERGHFTELMREHNWPPGFLTQIKVDPRTHRFAPAPRSTGFDKQPLGLAGAAEHLVRWEEQRARARA